MAVKTYSYSKNKNDKLSAHFQVWEFVSPSDYYGNYPETFLIDDRLVPMLEDLYSHFNCGRIDICSGYRTPECDKAVGGSGSGPHTSGKAVDAYLYDKKGNPVPSRFVACYLQDKGQSGIGLNCGGNPNGTHIDFLDRVWHGDERDYSITVKDYYNYTNTKKSEVYPNNTSSTTSTTAATTPVASTVKKTMSTSDNMINIIKIYEGLSLKACKAIPSETYWTIGYGHYGPDVSTNQTITEAQAVELLKSNLKTFENCVNSNIKVGLTQNQFDACVSLAYNIGTGAFAKSDIVSFINSGKIGHACVDFPSWRKAGGQVLPGLERRRQTELSLFGEGADFTLADNMNVRVSAGTNAAIKKVSQITTNGRKCTLSINNNDNAVFKSGTVVTALELKTVSTVTRVDVWLRCPSGWICARQGDDVFVV